MIAPFGNVDFKTYLLAEILTDCSIAINDVGRTAIYFQTDEWNQRATKLSDPLFAESSPIKWLFYLLTILPYMWRMNQNLRKWLVYNHRLQAFNALKYFVLASSQVCAIIYYEGKIGSCKYLYYGLKAVGCAYKYFWDLYYDWGLLRGSRRQKDGQGGHRLLRNELKYPPWFYYISMVYNLFGLYSWAIAIMIAALIQPQKQDDVLQYYNNIIWITWFEFALSFIRRTVWVVIRVESEFFNNFEQYRDVVTIPPIKYEE